MQDITKRFGDVLALSHVNFGVKKAEVHALLGENGAGKTTLMNVLYGLYRADEGTIELEGGKVTIRSPRDALDKGISMVHQHFRLIPNFTAFENILLGTGHGLHFQLEAQRKKLDMIAKEYGLSVDLDAKVKALPVGAQQRVEILKVLTRDPRVLILDEPTSSLTPQEADVMLAAIKKLARSGLAVVFITHKVREVMETADRITVLRGGKNVGSISVADAGEGRLVELMMGGKDAASSLLQAGRGSAQSGRKGEPLLVVSGLTVEGRKGVDALKGLGLTVNSGEILGVAGVSGNGQREFAEAVVSVRKPKSGSIKLGGVELTKLGVRKVIALGAEYIPEDRMLDGILPTMTVAENLMLGRHRSPPFSSGFTIHREAAASDAETQVKDYNIKTPSIEAHAGALSGGNVQKILLARAFMTQARLVVAHNPTRGLDLATTDLALRKMIGQKEGGAAVILICEDLDELMSVSDRICVLYRGELMGVVESKEFDRYEIGSMMAGERRKTTAV